MSLHIEVGMIVPGRAGGIFVTESALVAELRKLDDVTVGVFEFGSRVEDEGSLQRLRGRLVDLIEYDRRMRRTSPDVVYINSSFNRRGILRDLGYSIVSRLRGVRLVVKYHGTDSATFRTRGSLWFWITKVIFACASAIVVLSREEIATFECLGIQRSKLRLMKNALDLSTWAQVDCQKQEPPTILFIARLIKEKGLLELVRATRLLADTGQTFRVCCVGEGPVRREAEMLADQLGVATLIEFRGFVPEADTPELYRRASILAFPSYFPEGLPMAILQGAACGLPIVTTPVRAVGDYLEEPTNCLWVEPRNPAMLADRLRAVLESPEMRLQMSQENRKMVLQFGAGRVAHEYLALFKTVATASGSKAMPRRPAQQR